MMKSYAIVCWCVALLAVISCRPSGPVTGEKPSSYYNIDSLLTASLNASLEPTGKVRVNKQVGIDEETETAELEMDSAALAKEIGLFRMLDINQPSLTFSYDEIKENGVLTYRLKEREKQEGILRVSIIDEASKTTIKGQFAEQNSLYYTERALEVVITNGKLSAYNMEGLQKMALKDTVKYTLKGVVLK